MTSYQAIEKKNKQLIHLKAESVFDVTAGLVKSVRPDGPQWGREHHPSLALHLPPRFF